MRITVNNGMASVYTPYNKDFIAKIKAIGGRKWNAAEKCWMVPETEIDTVRQYMMDVYGETDQLDDSEKVTVRVTFNKDAYAKCDGIVLFGKTIARAWGRDSGAKVGDEATFEKGSPKSGGSVRNWNTIIPEGSIVKIRNITRTALDLGCDYDIDVEEIKTVEIDKLALEEEKAKLLARLAEIEKLLA